MLNVGSDKSRNARRPGADIGTGLYPEAIFSLIL